MKEHDLLRGFYSARDGALRVLLAVDREGAYANLALQKLTPQRKLHTADTAFLTELVYGSLRMRNHLDWLIDQFSKLPAVRMNDTVRNILRLGVYQLLFLERIPAAAVCNESVRLVKTWKLGGLAGFVNGLLRNIDRRREQITYPTLSEKPGLHISVKHSHPLWLVERWLRRMGTEETIALCRANNTPPPLVLRCNTLKTTPEKLRQELERSGLTAWPSPLLPEGVRVKRLTFLPKLTPFQNGHFVAQDESSMLTSHVLHPQPGSFVLDACSGPGGKTTHLAQIMGDRGKILALDVHKHRLELIRETCRRLGISIVETRLLDARRIPRSLHGKADCLLVDVPCSGLGVIRRRPDLRWRVAPGDLAHHAQEQLEILKSVCQSLKTGGVLLYSTCSTEPEENEALMSRFLREEGGFQPEDISHRIPFPLVYEEDRRTARAGFLQLLPHRHETDGFFMACLRKSNESR